MKLHFVLLCSHVYICCVNHLSYFLLSEKNQRETKNRHLDSILFDFMMAPLIFVLTVQKAISCLFIQKQ